MTSALQQLSGSSKPSFSKTTLQKDSEILADSEGAFDDESLSISGKRWITKPLLERHVQRLAQTYSLPELMVRLLLNRNVDEADIDAYLNPSLKTSLPDPFHLKDMEIVCERLYKAITTKKEKIAVFGDYDVDGATSSALLKRYFQHLGHDLDIYIPDREKEGYGPNKKALQSLKDKGISLVIAVDCGTTAFEAIEFAKHIKLDMVIIDHHIAEPNLPECVGVINPNRLDQIETDCKDLAAVGVVFMTLVALQKRLREGGFFQNRPEPNLLSFLDLVALGTVCDVVPLRGLNRVFVTQGLKVMCKQGNAGLTELADVSGLTSMPTAYHLGFLLGPRINAGGRVGQSYLGAELLSSDDPAQCRQIATQLDIFNQQRKDIEAFVLEQALEKAQEQKAQEPLENELATNDENSVIVVADRGWHPGVIGIVAGRLKDTFYKPSFVISFDENGVGKGSARSVTGLDIGSLIQAAKQVGLLENGGGHAMAGGLTIKESKLSDFKAFCHERVSHLVHKKQVDLVPALKVDGTLSFGGVTIELLQSIQQLAPFGQGNPGPKIRFDSVHIIKATIVGDAHISCIVSDFEKTKSLKAIAFRALGTPLGDFLLDRSRQGFFSMVGSLKLDEWNGRQTIQFIIEDVK